jgi:hypothetical protein
MRLRIAGATPAAATNEVALRYVWRSDGWRNPGRHHGRSGRFLKRPGGLAIRPSGGRESQYQYQQAAHCSFQQAKLSRIAIGSELLKAKSSQGIPQGRAGGLAGASRQF